MKKIIVILAIIFAFNKSVNALELKKEVELVNCTSLSNIWIKDNNEIKRIHLLAFESPSGILDNEINNYVCTTLKEAKKLEIVHDKERIDKYNRELVYLYVDGRILEEDLIRKGYGQVDNVNTYLELAYPLCAVQKQAIKEKLGIWKYPNIKENYCNSGITLNNEEETFTKKETNHDNNYIKYITLIESGILLLFILMKRD